jgi:hypothetical protein
MVKITGPTQSEIAEMQSFYDDGNSLRDTQKQFGWCRVTLLKYLKTRQPENISDEERKKRANNKIVRWRQRAKQTLVEYKGNKCKVCGYNKCVASLVFHHINPKEKEFGITGKCISIERLKKEADKCVLLCANCHGEIHSGLITI